MPLSPQHVRQVAGSGSGNHDRVGILCDCSLCCLPKLEPYVTGVSVVTATFVFAVSDVC